jgi:hypothetical protein
MPHSSCRNKGLRVAGAKARIYFERYGTSELVPCYEDSEKSRRTGSEGVESHILFGLVIL